MRTRIIALLAMTLLALAAVLAGVAEGDDPSVFVVRRAPDGVEVEVGDQVAQLTPVAGKCVAVEEFGIEMWSDEFGANAPIAVDLEVDATCRVMMTGVHPAADVPPDPTADARQPYCEPVEQSTFSMC